MRAWKMTAGLAVAAVLAALLAPRLIGRLPTPETVTPVQMAVPVADIVPITGERHPTRISAIPEVSAVPVLPAVPVIPQPDPTLEENWMEMVDCGMG